MGSKVFKSIKKQIVPSTHEQGRLWQICGDNHVAVVTVTFDKNAGPNKIAALPKGHPMKRGKNKIAIERDASVAVQPDEQHFYSFAINPRVKEKEFSDAAQDMIVQGIVPALMLDAVVMRHEAVVVYPAKGQEKHVGWIKEAFVAGAAEYGLTVMDETVHTAEKTSVQGLKLIEAAPLRAPVNALA